MKRERIQHIIGIIGCLPMLYVVVLFLIDDPNQFNPWAKGDGAFLNIRFTIILLPVLIGTMLCLANSITGLVLSQRTKKNIKQVEPIT